MIAYHDMSDCGSYYQRLQITWLWVIVAHILSKWSWLTKNVIVGISDNLQNDFCFFWLYSLLYKLMPCYHIHSSSWRTTKYYWASIQSNMANTDFKKPKFESLLITIWAWTITACLSIKSNYLITYLYQLRMSEYWLNDVCAICTHYSN